MYHDAPLGIRWKDCANFSGVVTLPSTARSPVTKVRMPPPGVGCESEVVILCWTVWNWSVCGEQGAAARVWVVSAESAADARARRQAGTSRQAGTALATYRELCHDALHAHELLVLKGQERLVGVQRLQIRALRIEG